MFDKNLSLGQLFKMRGQLIIEGKDITRISEEILKRESEYLEYLNEDSGTGGPSGAVNAGSVGYGGAGVAYSNASMSGSGAIVSAQPSNFAGVTTEPGYSAGGGTVGSGDISVPYNPGGRKKVFQKLAANSDRKGSNKRRKNKIIQGLKNIFSQKQDYTASQGKSRPSKIMNFNNFSKEELNKVTKVKEI